MKILALNGSPRMKASSTYHMLKPLIEGMEAAGADVDLLHIRRLDLKECNGCYTCWIRTPGVCIYKDSMTEALKLYNEADMVIFGTPLYHYSMSGIMKTFIDRTLPRYEPWLIPNRNRPEMSGHPERFDKPNKMMLVSPCGFPEFDNFDALVATFKQIAYMEGFEYVGDILRPAAEVLSRRDLQNLFTAYYALLRQAGREIIVDGVISPELQRELRKDLLPGGKQAFYDMADAYWTQQMDRFDVPDEKRRTVPIPPAAPADSDNASDAPKGTGMVNGRYLITNKQMLDYMVGMYNANALPDLRATIQFTIAMPTGVDFDAGAMAWYMDIGGGQCRLYEGQTAVPTLSITTPYEVWYDIGLGKINAQEAFTEGKYDAHGSMTVLEQFPQIFQYPQPGKSGEVEMLMLGMPTAFNKEAAKGLNATIQFVLGGAGGGLYHLRIANSICTAHTTPAPDADLTIYAPADLWLAISRGKSDGQAAFMAGKYRAIGDMGIMLKMNTLFTNTGDAAASPSPDPINEEIEMKEETIDRNSLNCHDTIAGMPTVFNAEAAGGLTAVIQFHVTGKEPGDYYLAIENGRCTFSEGAADAPSLTINTPSEIWLAISRGEMSGQTAFIQQKYTVQGDFSVLLKMDALFSS